jgi:hypothetical protein
VARDLRLMAAQGLLPLKPEDLLELWTDLVGDPDKDVRTSAEMSLGSFPAGELVPIAKSRDTPPAVLSWVVTYRREQDVREAALQNASLPDETIEALAPTLTQALSELVVINQTRLLRRVSLLVALESNAGLSNDQKRRLRELRESFRIGEPGAPAPPPAPPAPPAAAEPPPAEALAEPEPVEEAPVSEDEYKVRVLTAEEQQHPEKVSVVQKVYRLGVIDKMKLAITGSREERAILIRDPNRLVAAAVLGSPKITEPEIESISAMKNVSDQTLRTNGNHREWTKRYPVVANLVRNPRTPIGIALSMVPRLNPRDIKGVALDRNVPEAVRKQAQKFVKGVPAR